jgi:hypothetical protein
MQLRATVKLSQEEIDFLHKATFLWILVFSQPNAVKWDDTRRGMAVCSAVSKFMFKTCPGECRKTFIEQCRDINR